MVRIHTVLSAILFIFGPNIYICELALVKSTQITFIKTQIALFKDIYCFTSHCR
jgi:hypothetical protein